jgi:hypothetical protein
MFQAFFDMCSRSLACFKSDTPAIGQTLPAGDAIIAPVRHFVAQFYRRHLVGAASLALAAAVAADVAEASAAAVQHSDLAEAARSVVDGRATFPALARDKVSIFKLSTSSV